MVGPTWMSLICTMEKPCSSGGRPATGTSTRRTAAVRRALAKPRAVASSASTGAPRADQAAMSATGAAGARAHTPSSSSRATSRSIVSTSRDEKKPMATSPATCRAPAPGRPRSQAGGRSDQGISSADASSSPAPATSTAGWSGHQVGRRRQPT